MWCQRLDYRQKSRYVVLLYKTDNFSGELKSSAEGEMTWIPIEKLSEMELANDMDELLRIFLSDCVSEQFFEKIDGKWQMRIT